MENQHLKNIKVWDLKSQWMVLKIKFNQENKKKTQY